MFCPQCRTELPDNSNYCWKCGRAIMGATVANRPAARLEYRELVIPLDIQVKGDPQRAAEQIKEQFAARVREQLERERLLAGWLPDELIDFDTLQQYGRIKSYEKATSFWPFAPRLLVFESVTIRLRREPAK